MKNMHKKLKVVLNKTKGARIGLFVDDANWFYPKKELGWDIDLNKLIAFLGSYYKIGILKYYTGTPLDMVQLRKSKSFKRRVEAAGFQVTTKPLKKIWVDREAGQFIFKCNFDVEIALDVTRSVKDIDLVMIGSGDSDFLAIRDFSVKERSKGFITLCFEKGVAWEVRRGYHIFLEDIKGKIELK